MKLKTKSCAVLIATHNGASFISEQLASIRGQIGVHCDVYFSDDGSCDFTRDIALSYGCEDLNTEGEIFNSSAQNFFSLIKKFNKSNQYDYVFLADQDDIWLPRKMQRAICQMEEQNAEFYSSSFYRYSASEEKIVKVDKHFNQNCIDFLFRSPGPGFTFAFSASAFAFIKANIDLHQRDLSSVRWHDWAIYAIARGAKQKWIIDQDANSLYRIHSLNDTGQALTYTDKLNRIMYLLSGKYRFQVELMSRISSSTEIQQKIKRFNLIDRIYFLSKLTKMRNKFTDRMSLLVWLIVSKK